MVSDPRSEPESRLARALLGKPGRAFQRWSGRDLGVDAWARGSGAPQRAAAKRRACAGL